jgi:hypothetical protein
MPATSSPHSKNRIVLFLRLWAHGQNEPIWIGEVQDIATGETIHTQNLEALFDWLRQKTSQALESSGKKVANTNGSSKSTLFTKE